MENSFYYFFSAVPQVLAAIMVMFGVIIMYKIADIKSSLIGSGKIILDLLKQYPKKRISKKYTNKEIIKNLEYSLVQGKVGLVSIDISYIELIKNDKYKFVVRLYDAQRKFLLALIKETIIMTLLTSTTIIICLTIIPFGEKILKDSAAKDSSYITIGILIFICLAFYTHILSKCLGTRELFYSPKQESDDKFNLLDWLIKRIS
jgi:hypothetical protein